MNRVPFTRMYDTARKIENLALLLRCAAETGQLANMGDDVAEDAAAMIQANAARLKEMIEHAEADTAAAAEMAQA